MLGRAGVILAAAVLSSGAAAAGGTGGGGLWDPHGSPPRVSAAGALTAAGRDARGTCELAGADRARTPSARCMACHDGSAGAQIPFQMSPDRSGMSHPVEVDYGAVALRDPARYGAPGLLPPEVPLVGGKVACTSCHDGASRDPKKVAMVPRLCESCHRM